MSGWQDIYASAAYDACIAAANALKAITPQDRFEAALRSYLESGASFADVELCVKRAALQRDNWTDETRPLVDWSGLVVKAREVAGVTIPKIDLTESFKEIKEALETPPSNARVAASWLDEFKDWLAERGDHYGDIYEANGGPTAYAKTQAIFEVLDRLKSHAPPLATNCLDDLRGLQEKFELWAREEPHDWLRQDAYRNCAFSVAALIQRKEAM